MKKIDATDSLSSRNDFAISDAYNTFMGFVMGEEEEDVVTFLSHPTVTFLVDLKASSTKLSLLHMVCSVVKVCFATLL
jgi:hypothetical protein